MWVTGLDMFTHLVLPTLALLLISFALHPLLAGGHARGPQPGLHPYGAREGPARADVVVRHAFRNVLIPITTLVAFDIGALLGGAVITEHVFAIPGMGRCSTWAQAVTSTRSWAYFLVIAVMAVMFNFLADLSVRGTRPASEGPIMTDRQHSRVVPTSRSHREAPVSQGRSSWRFRFRHRAPWHHALILCSCSCSFVGLGDRRRADPRAGGSTHYTRPQLNDGRPTLQCCRSRSEHPFGQDRIGATTSRSAMRGIQNSIVVMI